MCAKSNATARARERFRVGKASVSRLDFMPDRDASRRRRAIYAALALLSLFSVALVVARYAYSQEPRFGGLIWNLFLAWIPFGLAIFVYDRHRVGARTAGLLPFAALWLLSSCRTRPTSSPTSSTSSKAVACRSGSTSS